MNSMKYSSSHSQRGSLLAKLDASHAEYSVILETAIFLEIYVETASCGEIYCYHVKKL